MALNLEGYSTPEKSYGQLYNLGEANERREYRREQLQQREEGRKAATGTFLSNYLDKKDFLTGTNYDPEIVRRLDEMMVQGAELATKGATTPEIMMALGPKVSEVGEYSTKAKLVNQNLEKQLEYIKATKGYDPIKLREEARKMAFYGEDGKLKDISTVDPSQDFVMETIRMFPDRVTNDAALDEFVKNSPKYVDTKDITTYAPTGKMNKKKMKVTAPDWLTIDNGDLVPEFEVATDNGSPIMHDFVGEDGKVTKAPVRMIKDDRFTSIMRSNPGVADYVRGQVKAQLGDGDMNSPQAKNLAKAILYDELKKRKGGGMEEVVVENKPSAPEIRMAFTGSPYAPRSSSSSGGDASSIINDIHGRLSNKVSSNFNNGGRGTSYNSLSNDEQEVVKKAVENAGYTVQERGKNIFLTQDGDKIRIHKTTDGKTIVNEASRISELPFIGTNISKQANVKGKVATVAEGNNKPKPQSGMVTMVMPDGKTGQIPADKVEAFLKKYPKAKRK
jgi:hypothetical protein